MSKNSNSRLQYALYVFTLGMLCAFAPMCSDMYLPSLPEIVTYFDSNPAQVQFSLTASFLGLALGQIVIGPVSDAYGRIKPLLVCLVIFTLSSLACALSPNICSFVFFRLLQGLSAAGGIVLTRSIACDKFKGNELTSFMSFLMAINSLGPILGPIIGSLVVTYFSWPVIFFILVGWGLILIYLTKFHVPESLAVEKREKNALVSILRMKTDLLNLKFMLTVFSLSFVMGGFFSYLAASPFVFQKVYGFTPIEYSFTFAFIAICISIIASSAGRLSRRLSELKVVIIAYVLLLISGIGVLIISLVQPESFVPILGCLAIYCAMMGLSQSAGFGVVISFKKGGAGSASGIFGVMYFLIGSLVSPFVGVMGELSMIPFGINLSVCAILAIVFLYFAVRIKDENNSEA